jgi:UDP-N-acetylglucosamine diphosphorylase/glucosamine-1-phosphate N-acetyltransferase
MELCVFEDATYSNFAPLTYLRPTFLLRCGIFTLAERIAHTFSSYDVSYLCRPYLNPTLRERQMRMLSPFEITPEKSVLFINGTLLDTYAVREEISHINAENWVLVSGGRLLAAQLKGELAQEAAYYLLEQNTNMLMERFAGQVEIEEFSTLVATYLWDLIHHNGEVLKKDFEHLKRSGVEGNVDSRAVLYNEGDVFVGKGAQVDAFAVLDARDGPVYIAEGVKIQPFTYIQGPTFIGAKTYIVGGQIREGTTIGPVCRIGGEVEEAIIQGYTNKYHAGFLGHSYLGEWVNIGAIGTNSDLKNTYGTIRIDVNDVLIDTGMQKMGIIIGDHAKIGIGTMVMAGTVIGVGSNVMGSVVPKVVPSFIWGSEEGFAEYRIDKCIEVARATMGRRSLALSEAQSNLMNHVFYLTARQRQPMLK